MPFFINSFIFLSLTFASLTHAENYLSYFLTKKGNDNIHHLSKLNPHTAGVSNVVELGTAINKTSLVYSNTNSELIVIYLEQMHENDKLVVLNKDSLQEVSQFEISRHDSLLSKKSNIFSVFISSDDEKVSIISADNKSSEINIYDIKTGKNLYNNEINGHDFNLKRSKDLDYIVVEYSTLQNNYLRVIDINKLKTTVLQNLGQFPIYTHVFNNSMMIASEKPDPRGTQFKLSKINFDINKVIKYKDMSLTPFVFTSDKDENELFVVGRNTEKKKDLFVMRIDKQGQLNKTNYKKKSNPLNAVLNKNNSRLMIIGENKLSTINLENNTLQSRIRIPFDPLDGIVNNQGTIGYVQENNGSQVGNFDLVSGKLIEQSSAGRFFKQVLVNSRKTVLKVLIVGLVPAVVEMIFSLNNSNKNIMLSNDESQLFVINASTNDLSIFDAHTLKKQYAKSTGAKTFLMSQGPDEKSPILTIGKNKLNVFNAIDNSQILTLEDANLIGLDKEKDILFYTLNNTFHIFDMLNSTELTKTNAIDPIAIYVY